MNDHRWVFGEGSGATVADLIGSITGTVSGGMSWGGPGRNGIGGYIQASPQNSYVDFGVPVGQFGTTVFTVMMWIQTTDKTRLFDLCGNRNYASNGNFFGLRFRGDTGAVVAEVDQDQSGTNYAAATREGPALNDGVWHHIAVVRAGPSLQLYVDGVRNTLGVGAGPANVSNNTPFRLASSNVIPNSGVVRYTDLCILRDELGPDELSHSFHFH
jgi:hypothetical protein